MNNLKNTIVDTSLVEEFIAYLRKEHNVNAWVEDGYGAFVPLEGTEAAKLPYMRFYPFESGDSIGGIQCAAECEETLRRAEPHILFGVKGISHLLLRDMEFLQAGDEMLQLSSQMAFLFKLSRKTLGVTRVNAFCRLLLEEIAPSIQADFGVVHTQKQGDLEIDILYNLTQEEYAQLRGKELDQIPAWNTTVISSLADETSVLYCPIKEKSGPIGYLAFFRKADKHFFTSYEKQFVSIIEHFISPVIETIRLYGNLQDLYMNTVRALATAIDAKDPYTHGHSFRVAWFSNAIGRQLGLSDAELRDLDTAAYMHDVGKIGVPESILGKPGKLTPEEYIEAQKHALLTNKILEPIHLSPSIVDAAVQHHERVDGSGYPFGLTGEQISPLARIIAVADVFDAMTSKRPYRNAMTVEDALRILCEGIGSAFDRRMVQAFLRVFESGEIERNWLLIMPDLQIADFAPLNQLLADLSQNILRNTATGEQAGGTGTTDVSHS